MTTIMKRVLTAAVAVGLCLSAAAHAKTHREPAFPAGTPGAQLFVQSTGQVTLTYLGSYAHNVNTLFLNDQYVFNSLVTPVGKTVYDEFEAGTELVFKLNSFASLFNWKNYYSGPASNNADKFAHASVVFNAADNTALVGFEDLWKGGDKDYNDLMFKVTNVGATAPIPEPTSIALLAGGLGVLVARKRFKANA